MYLASNIKLHQDDISSLERPINVLVRHSDRVCSQLQKRKEKNQN
jgi:hypothetical protein